MTENKYTVDEKRFEETKAFAEVLRDAQEQTFKKMGCSDYEKFCILINHCACAAYGEIRRKQLLDELISHVESLLKKGAKISFETGEHGFNFKQYKFVCSDAKQNKASINKINQILPMLYNDYGMYATFKNGRELEILADIKRQEIIINKAGIVEWQFNAKHGYVQHNNM